MRVWLEEMDKWISFFIREILPDYPERYVTQLDNLERTLMILTQINGLQLGPDMLKTLKTIIDSTPLRGG